MFENVEGYDDVKKILIRALESKKPVHILLVGPPGSAKSLVLEEIGNLPGAQYVLGGSTKKAGLVRYLMENNPEFLVFDELDKTVKEDQSALLSLMSNQLVAEMKTGRVGVRKGLNVKVFAACNDITQLRPELTSRFMKFTFKPYTKVEFIRVVDKVLIKHEGIEKGLSIYIAKKCFAEGFTDVRDAIRIAALAKNRREVDEMFKVLLKYQIGTRYYCNNPDCPELNKVVRIVG